MSKKFLQKKLPDSISFRNLFSSKSESNSEESKVNIQSSRSTGNLDLSKDVLRTFSTPDTPKGEVGLSKTPRSDPFSNRDSSETTSPRKIKISLKKDKKNKAKKEEKKEYEDESEDYSGFSSSVKSQMSTPIVTLVGTPMATPKSTPIKTPPAEFYQYEEFGDSSRNFSLGSRTSPPKAAKKLSFISRFTKDGAGAVGKDKFVNGEMIIKGVAPEYAGLIGAFSAGDIFASGEQDDFQDDDFNF